MSLNALLIERGISKQKLAEIMGVTRKTVQRMGDEVSEEVLEALNEHVEVAEPLKMPEDYTDAEISALCKRRGGIEADVDRIKETDYEIACSIGFDVFDFHAMIDRMTGRKRPQIRGNDAVINAFTK